MPPMGEPAPAQDEADLNTKEGALRQRRGPKGYFQGSRKEFLESYLPAYLASKKGNRQKFWHELYSAWWQRYPWRLDNDKEPPADDPEKMARLAAVAPGDEPQKSLVERTLTNRLTTWFITCASSVNSGSRRDSLSWLPLLRRLHQLRNPRPRQRTAVQQFMQDYPREVNAAFVARHGDGKNISSGNRLNLRYEIAKALLSHERAGLVNELENKAKAEHIVEMNEWNMILDDISSANDVGQARDNLFDAVFPLLQAIGSYAGCYVTLIAGNSEVDHRDEGFFTAVHWWPGDRAATKDWTRWNEDGFNSGVAGPFLTYTAENNQLLQGANKQQPVSSVQKPHALTGNTPPIANTVTPGNIDASRIQSAATTANRPTRYHPLPTKTKPSTGVNGALKRKHSSKETRTIEYLEDSESASDTNNQSGDGSSSGNSIHSDAVRTKRQRTSQVATRSSVRNATPRTAVGAPDLTSLPSTVHDPQFGSSTDTDTEGVTPTGAASTLTSRPKIVCDTNAGDAKTTARTTGTTTPDTDDFADTNTIDRTNAGGADHANDDLTRTNTDGAVGTNTDSTIGTDTNNVVAADALNAASHPFSPTSLDDIDEATIPTFLIRHGTGKRQVNILNYLKGLEDSHFQHVLLNYLCFVVNDKSGSNGSLPTAKRPVEIGYWSSRARPDCLPDYTRGGRTYTTFVDSVFTWWASIQPAWRKFKRGKVSRKVCGEWGVLYAPSINGLLNIVVLVYWWAKILEEDKPEDGMRSDYEFFADDVAWVLSNLLN